MDIAMDNNNGQQLNKKKDRRQAYCFSFVLKYKIIYLEFNSFGRALHFEAASFNERI